MYKVITTATAIVGLAFPMSAAALSRAQGQSAAQADMSSESVGANSQAIDGCIFTGPRAITCEAIFSFAQGIDCYQAIHVRESIKGVIKTKHSKSHCYSSTF